MENSGGKSGRTNLSASAPAGRASSLLSTTLLRDKHLRIDVVKGKSIVYRDQVCRAKLMWEIGSAKFKRNLVLVLTPKNEKKSKDINIDMYEMRLVTACDRFPSEVAASFSMHFKKKAYHCVADNEDDMFGWVAAIQSAMEESRVQEGAPLLYHVTVIDSPGNDSQGERLLEFHPRWKPHSLVFRSPLNQVVVYSCDIVSIKAFGYSSRTGHLWLKVSDGSQVVLHINGVTAAHVARILKLHLQDSAGELDVNDQMENADRISYTVAGSNETSFFTPNVVLQSGGSPAPVGVAANAAVQHPLRKISKANTIHSYPTEELNGFYEPMAEVKHSAKTLTGIYAGSAPALYEKMDGEGTAFRYDQDPASQHQASVEDTSEDLYDNTVLQPHPTISSESSLDYDHLTQPHLIGSGDAAVSPATDRRLNRTQSASSSLDSQDCARYERLFTHIEANSPDHPAPDTPDATGQTSFQRSGARRFTAGRKNAAGPRRPSVENILQLTEQIKSLPGFKTAASYKPPLPGEDSDSEHNSQSLSEREQPCLTQHTRTKSHSPYEAAFDEHALRQPQAHAHVKLTKLSRRACSETNLTAISVENDDDEDEENYVVPEIRTKGAYSPRAPPLPPDPDTDWYTHRLPKLPAMKPVFPKGARYRSKSNTSADDCLINQTTKYGSSGSATLGTNWLTEPVTSNMYRARSDSDLSKHEREQDIVKDTSEYIEAAAPVLVAHDEHSSSPASEDDYVNVSFHMIRSRSPPSHTSLVPVSKEVKFNDNDEPSDYLGKVEHDSSGGTHSPPSRVTSPPARVMSPPARVTSPQAKSTPVPKPRKLALAKPSGTALSPPPSNPPQTISSKQHQIPKKSPRRSKSAFSPPTNDKWQDKQMAGRREELKELQGVSVAKKAQSLAGQLEAVMFMQAEKARSSPGPYH
eukprot:scpid46587/ scgid24589/ 